MNTRIAIVEDDHNAAELLSGYLDRYAAESNRKFDVDVFYNAGTFLTERGSFDIVLMDIELPDGNGLDVSRKLREQDENVLIIFVTNMASLAIKGYEVRAFDFVVKPVSYNSFVLKFSGAIDALRKKHGKDIWISNKDGKIKLNTTEIKYVEIMSHILIYHTVRGEYRETGTLAELQELLADEPFALCNRCYFVNLAYVTAVKQQYAVVGDESLQISRAKRALFKSALNNHIAMGVD